MAAKLADPGTLVTLGGLDGLFCRFAAPLRLRFCVFLLPVQKGSSDGNSSPFENSPPAGRHFTLHALMHGSGRLFASISTLLHGVMPSVCPRW
jgi:hypothetical protein